MSSPRKFLLAIESAIAGGSIALFQGEDLISSNCGNGAVSRAEELLPNIISMLDEAGIAKTDLSRIAVSLGPGSYTGLRIGIATAMGLKGSLGIEYVGVPLFEALASKHQDSAVAVPMGKTDVCWTDSNKPTAPSVNSVEEFMQAVRANAANRTVIHPSLLDRVSKLSESHIEQLNPNLAEYVGIFAANHPASEQLIPIYIQNPRFG